MDRQDNKRQNNDVVVPVVNEEVHADAIPVQTGGVRVTKHIKGHDEILEQELRKGRVEVKRVKTDRVVDGPQPVQRLGNTLVVPVVSEVLHVEKRWVVTEEIHLTQIEERETVQQTVTVNREEADVERLDDAGNVVSTVDAKAERPRVMGRAAPESLVGQRDAAITPEPSTAKRKVLSGSRGMLKNRSDDLDRTR
ncbi:MAG: YsnF/AvaK domain-containing protein [Bryobacteraceae bacterium]